MPTGSDWALVTLADHRYFPGVLALWASVGQACASNPPAEFVVLDAGLAPAQSKILSDIGARLVCVDATLVTSAVYLKPAFADVLTDHRVVCYSDADVVVLSSLDSLIAAAEGGRLGCLPDWLHPRSPAEWRQAFPGRLQRQLPYFNAGFLVASQVHTALLERWRDLCGRISDVRTVKEGWVSEGPWMFGDQDALNATARAFGAELEFMVDHPPPVIPGDHSDRLKVGSGPNPSVTWDRAPLTVWHFAGDTNPWIGGENRLQRLAHDLWWHFLEVWKEAVRCA